MTKKYIVFFDGACEPKNPGGIATWGYSIELDEREIDYDKGVIGEGNGMTNNVAEYTALIISLKKIISTVETNDIILIYGDSNLAINQLNGVWSLKSEGLKKYFNDASEILSTIRNNNIQVRLSWIPREKNNRADELSHNAFIEYCKMKNYIYIPCTCGGTLIPRENKKTGGKFLGCNRFPRCRNTLPYPEQT